MNTKDLKKIRELLIQSKIVVSELEYTKGNYDNGGNLIEEDLPTLTTDFCEIGLCAGEIYFVFIVKSKTFKFRLFDELKNRANVKIYGFEDFNKTYFPSLNFNVTHFVKEIQKEPLLQIQFDFKNVSIFDLLKEYINLIDMFSVDEVEVVNQLNFNLKRT